MEDVTRIFTPKIRKIVIGDIKDGVGITVGQLFSVDNGRKIEITEIVRDDNNFFLFGVLRYLVYGKIAGSDKPPFMWKFYENQIVNGECFAENEHAA